MRRKRKPFFEKLKNIVPAEMEEIFSADRTTFFPADFWAPLKLYCLHSYINNCYSKIANNLTEGNFYFIDLLSSSGVAFISKCKKCVPEPDKCRKCPKNNEPKDPVIGSPIIAALSTPPFRRMYFMEKEDRLLKILEKRLVLIKKKQACSDICWKLVPGDSNSNIDVVLNKIVSSGKYHLLAFVDNQALDINWATIEKLCKLYSDVIINFPTSNVGRAVGQAKNPRFKKFSKINAFFGCDIIKEVPSADEKELIAFYIKRIVGLGKAVYKIPINTGIAYHYDLLFVTRKSEQKTYERFIEGLKRNIERMDAEQIKRALSIIGGRQATLLPITST